MDKKIAAVTGGNRGIGFQICRDLAKKGFKVLLTARDPEKGNRSARNLQDEGLDVEFYPLDVVSMESIDKFSEKVLTEFGQLHVLVNNAAILPDEISPALSVGLEEVRETIETNVYGVLRLSQKLIPTMIENNYGRIINLSSGMGQLSDMGSGYLAYRVSKTALNAVTRVLAQETSGYDIQINAVDPGWVKTDMGGSNAPSTPEEGADTVVWLSTRPAGEPSGMFYKNRKIIDW